MKDCEECGTTFEPQPVNYINGYSADYLCEECCDREAEAQFYINDLYRQGTINKIRTQG